jgi:NAD(P)H-flavin reductase
MMNTAAALPGVICKLKDRKEVAEGTMAFRFEKPSGWTFKPGQYLDMTLLDPRRRILKAMCAVFRSQAPLTKKP